MDTVLPKNLENMSYEEIHNWVNKNIHMNAPIIKAKLKFKHDPEIGWNQFNNNLDMLKDYQHVKNVCGDNIACWMDSMHYSFMSKNDITDFLYRMSANTGQVIRKGVDKEIANFEFTPTPGMEKAIDKVSEVKEYSRLVLSILDFLS